MSYPQDSVLTGRNTLLESVWILHFNVHIKNSVATGQNYYYKISHYYLFAFVCIGSFKTFMNYRKKFLKQEHMYYYNNASVNWSLFNSCIKFLEYWVY